MQRLSGNQRQDLLTSLTNMYLALRLAPNSSLQILFKSVNVPRLPTLLELLQNHQVLLVFSKVQNPLRLPHKRHLKRPKMLRTRHSLTLLTSKCASRHNGVLRDRQL